MKSIGSITFILLILVFTNLVSGQTANYDESKIPEFTLPELLITNNGEKITDAKGWMKKRRPEVLALFENTMYGKIPGKLKISSWKVLEESNDALNGKAIRKQILLTFSKNNKELDVNLLVYLPKGIKKAPLFVDRKSTRLNSSH